MPFLVKEPVSHGGQSFNLPDVVTDDLGTEILAEHPHAVVRIAFDADLCANMKGVPAPAPAVKAVPAKPEAAN